MLAILYYSYLETVYYLKQDLGLDLIDLLLRSEDLNPLYHPIEDIYMIFMLNLSPTIFFPIKQRLLH